MGLSHLDTLSRGNNDLCLGIFDQSGSTANISLNADGSANFAGTITAGKKETLGDNIILSTDRGWSTLSTAYSSGAMIYGYACYGGGAQNEFKSSTNSSLQRAAYTQSGIASKGGHSWFSQTSATSTAVGGVVTMKRQMWLQNSQGNLYLGGDLESDTISSNEPNITLNASGSAEFKGDVTIADSDGNAVIFLDNNHSMTLTGNPSDQFTIDTAADDDLVIGDNRSGENTSDTTVGVLDVQRTLQLDGDNGVIFTGTNSDLSGNYAQFTSPAVYTESTTYTLPPNLPNVDGSFRNRTRFIPHLSDDILGNFRLLRNAADPFILRSDEVGELTWGQLPIAQLADVSELCDPEIVKNGSSLIFRADFNPDGSQADTGEWYPGDPIPSALRFKGTLRYYSRPYAGQFDEPGDESGPTDYLDDTASTLENIDGEDVLVGTRKQHFWICSPTREQPIQTTW